MSMKYWTLKLLKGVAALAAGWLAFYLALLLLQLFDPVRAFRLAIRAIRAASWFAVAANAGFLLLYLPGSPTRCLWRRPWNIITPVVAAFVLASGYMIYWHRHFAEPWWQIPPVAFFIAIPGLATFLVASRFNRASAGKKHLI
ncbi:hypothetical protein OPIT5_09080 [Opitutaceae bacterium TAV5]|nr:hypothetical protein OPIT5_09080 [Opitutaceae bacterium TAV5]